MIKKETFEQYIFAILTTSVFVISLGSKIDSYFIFFFIILFFLSFFFSYFFFKTNKSSLIDFSKIFDIKNYIISIIALTFLYLINKKSFLTSPYSCKYYNLHIACEYYVIYFLLTFIIFLFFFSQIKVPDIRKIFIKFGLIIFIFSLLNMIIFYLRYFSIINFGYFIKFEGDYNFYWQFIPFALQGLRNFEIMPFILAYTSAISLFKSLNKKYEKYIYLFFISIFFTFSKNAWVATIIITLITLTGNKKNRSIIKKCFAFTIILILLISIFQKILIKEFHTNIIPYSIHKIAPSLVNKFNLFDKDYIDNFEKMYGLGGFENVNEHINYLFNSSLPRFNIYKNSIKNIFEKPMLGHGLNAYLEIENIFKEKISTDNYESHFLTVLIEVGFLGFIIYLYIFIYSFKKIKRNKEFYITLIVSLLSLALFNSYQRNIFIFYLLAFIFSNIILSSEKKTFTNKS